MSADTVDPAVGHPDPGYAAAGGGGTVQRMTYTPQYPLPDTVTVLGAVVRVLQRRKSEQGLASKVNLVGQYHSDNSTMDLDVDADIGTQRNTMVHELVHAVLYLTGHETSDDDHEALVMALGTGVLAVLRDNPALVRWLLS